MRTGCGRLTMWPIGGKHRPGKTCSGRKLTMYCTTRPSRGGPEQSPVAGTARARTMQALTVLMPPHPTSLRFRREIVSSRAACTMGRPATRRRDGVAVVGGSPSSVTCLTSRTETSVGSTPAGSSMCACNARAHIPCLSARGFALPRQRGLVRSDFTAAALLLLLLLLSLSGFCCLFAVAYVCGVCVQLVCKLVARGVNCPVQKRRKKISSALPLFALAWEGQWRDMSMGPSLY